MYKSEQPSKALRITMWVAQGLLSATFVMSGFMKSFMSVEELAAMLPWITSTPVELVRFIGFSQIAGGVGILLPSALRIKPVLTIWAASGLATIMLLAIPFHISRGETALIGTNIFFLLLCLFVAWGRWRKVPVYAK